MRLMQKGLILVALPLVVAMALSGTMYSLILRQDRQRVEDAQHKQLADNAVFSMLRLVDLLFCVERSFSGQDERFSLRLDEDIESLKVRFKQDFTELRALQAQTSALGRSAVGQQSKELYSAVKQGLDGVRQMMLALTASGMSTGSMEDLHQARRDLTGRSFAIGSQVFPILESARAYLEKRKQDEQASFQAVIVTLMVCLIASVGIALLLARWFALNIVERIKVVVDNTVRMSAGQRLNPLLSGGDEVCSLDRGFHSMAASVREAMAKESALFQDASDMICVLDGACRLVAVNAASERLLQYAPEQMLGRDIQSIIVEEDLCAMQQAIEQIKVSTRSCSIATGAISADGRRLYLLWSLYWSQLDNMLYAIAHDISGRKQIEQAKEEFLSMVTHDLRSPLAAIYGTFELLSAAEIALPEAAQAQVPSVVLHIKKLLALVNDLLDLDKLEANKLELFQKEANVEEVIRLGAADGAELASARNISISIDCAPVNFICDKERVCQVLINLLSNAIESSPDGSVIKVAASVSDEGLKIAVSDQGVSIDVSEKEYVFQRFSNVGKVRGEPRLGMAVCKRIVEQHGGVIGVDSQAGKGNCFWFSLPHERSAMAAAEVPSSPSREVLFEGAGIQENDLSMKQPKGKLPFSFDGLSIVSKGIILVAVPVFLELFCVASLYFLGSQAFQEQQREHHQRMVATTAGEVLLSHFLLGFSMSLRPAQRSWSEFSRCAKNIDRLESRLVELTRQDPESREVVQELSSFLNSASTFRSRAERVVAITGINENGLRAAYWEHEKLHDLAMESTPVFTRLISECNGRADLSPDRLEAIRRQQAMVLTLGLLASFAVCGVSAALFSRHIVRRLQTVEENMRRLEQGRPLTERLAGNDEVAQLDKFFAAMVQTIQEIRRKETAVFDNVQDVMCLLTEEGGILRINPIVESAWGYSLDKLEGTCLLSLMSDETAAEVRQCLLDMGVSWQPCALEGVIVCRDGSKLDVSWSFSRSRRGDGIVAIAHDISERKNLEGLKQEFLDMVSHGMRTPLETISLSCHKMLGGTFGTLPDTASAMLQIVERSCDRLLRLISDLLEIEKLESGLLPLDKAPVKAAAVLRQSVEALSGLSAKKGIKVDIQADEDILIDGDSARLVQVTVNLLSNALKFSDRGSVVQLSALREGEYVEFRVKDEGRGIPETHIESIFERYRQVTASDGRRYTGTGLGLPISRQIVEQHGGQIKVESQPGCGTTFYFRIPAVSVLLPGERVVAES